MHSLLPNWHNFYFTTISILSDYFIQALYLVQQNMSSVWINSLYRECPWSYFNYLFQQRRIFCKNRQKAMVKFSSLSLSQIWEVASTLYYRMVLFSIYEFCTNGFQWFKGPWYFQICGRRMDNFILVFFGYREIEGLKADQQTLEIVGHWIEREKWRYFHHCKTPHIFFRLFGFSI